MCIIEAAIKMNWINRYNSSGTNNAFHITSLFVIKHTRKKKQAIKIVNIIFIKYFQKKENTKTFKTTRLSDLGKIICHYFDFNWTCHWSIWTNYWFLHKRFFFQNLNTVFKIRKEKRENPFSKMCNKGKLNLLH